MNLAIAGGTGLLGSAIKQIAEAAGHNVTVLHVPRPPKPQAHRREAWHDALQEWKPATFAGFDGVMFFGGESVATRWDAQKRDRIQLSREMPCRRIAECIVDCDPRPQVVVSASAIGYYGERGDEVLTEQAGIGTGFLPTTTAAWEESWESAEQAGVRVVKLRIGVVLDPNGGALKMMLPAFKAGLGGKVGSGKQWMSWVTSHDVARLAVWALQNPSVTGPVNAVSPQPVRQYDFAKALAAELHRPAIAPAPAFVLKLIFGEMAEETVLLSCRVLPAKAAEAGFHFDHADLVSALRAVL